jgi:hypothetical protein
MLSEFSFQAAIMIVSVMITKWRLLCRSGSRGRRDAHANSVMLSLKRARLGPIRNRWGDRAIGLPRLPTRDLKYMRAILRPTHTQELSNRVLHNFRADGFDLASVLDPEVA